MVDKEINIETKKDQMNDYNFLAEKERLIIDIEQDDALQDKIRNIFNTLRSDNKLHDERQFIDAFGDVYRSLIPPMILTFRKSKKCVTCLYLETD